MKLLGLLMNILRRYGKITRRPFNTLRARQNVPRFADGIFKCIFLNENAWISLKISLKFVPKGQINNIPALVQIMAWRRPGGKPLSEQRWLFCWKHICVTRPQWVKISVNNNYSKHYDCRIFWSSVSRISYQRVYYEHFCSLHHNST